MLLETGKKITIQPINGVKKTGRKRSKTQSLTNFFRPTFPSFLHHFLPLELVPLPPSECNKGCREPVLCKTTVKSSDIGVSKTKGLCRDRSLQSAPSFGWMSGIHLRAGVFTCYLIKGTVLALGRGEPSVSMRSRQCFSNPSQCLPFVASPSPILPSKVSTFRPKKSQCHHPYVFIEFTCS